MCPGPHEYPAPGSFERKPHPLESEIPACRDGRTSSFRHGVDRHTCTRAPNAPVDQVGTAPLCRAIRLTSNHPATVPVTLLTASVRVLCAVTVTAVPCHSLGTGGLLRTPVDRDRAGTGTEPTKVSGPMTRKPPLRLSFWARCPQFVQTSPPESVP